MKMLFVLFIFFSMNMMIAHSRDLIIVGEDWAPFEFKDSESDNDVKGIDPDIIEAILNKRMNIKYKIKILPWERAWYMIENGEAEASLSTSRKEVRKPFLIYPEENMWVSEYVFFTHQDIKKANFDGYNSATKYKYKVGVIAGNSYNENFWKAKLKTVEAKDAEINFKKLDKKRIDLFIIDKTIGQYTLKNLGIKKITYYDKPLFSKGYPMPFSKKSNYPNLEKIASDFERHLKEIKKNGEYEKIMNKWLK